MAKNPKTSKRSGLKNYAQIGLWISGFFALVGGLLLLVKLISVMGLFTISNTKIFNWGLIVCLAFIIIGPAIFALIDPGKVREFITGRQARYGSNALILLIAFIGILVVANVITYQNPVQWDWTEDKSHTLAPETLATLKALPSPVQAIAFYTTNVPSTDAKNLLDDIKANSGGKFSYKFVDPNANPVEAQQYQVTRDATVVLLLGTQKELITTVSEQDVTNAMVRLMNPAKRTVYFLTGHGEHDTQTAGQSAYTRVKTVLESKNYTVQVLNLLAQNKVPTDASVIVIAGPTQAVPDQEIALLKDYVSKGGALVIMEEPTIVVKSNSSADPLADYLTADWGVTLTDDLVIDPAQNPPFLVVADEQNYGSHPITSELQGKIVFFPTARSIKSTSVANVTETDLVKTISGAWGETDYAALQNNQLAFDASKDLAGPLTVAVAAQNSSNNSRVVVIGDSDFADDTYFDQYSNSDMMINSIDWAAGQESIINLTTRQAISRQMVLPSNTTLLLISISVLCILPGLVLAGGVATWLMRRARG